MSVSVVVPAYNEADGLARTLAALRPMEWVAEIIVVDDGSTDDTAAAAEGAKTSVLRWERNRGKGAALTRGVQQAQRDVILLLDADLGDSAAAAAALWPPVAKDEADVVIASFGAARPAGFGIVQRVARAAIQSMTGLHLSSPLSGQRAIHRRVLTRVPRFASGFGAEVAFTVDAARAGFRIVEVPVAMTHRETGRDAAGFLHRGMQLCHVVKAVLSRIAGRPPAVGRAAEDEPS